MVPVLSYLIIPFSAKTDIRMTYATLIVQIIFDDTKKEKVGRWGKHMATGAVVSASFQIQITKH